MCLSQEHKPSWSSDSSLLSINMLKPKQTLWVSGHPICGVSAIIQRIASRISGISHQWETIKIRDTLIDSHDIWKPTSPIISVNDAESSKTQPQAWNHTITIHWHTHDVWFYNYLGALTEAHHQGKRLLSVAEWMNIFKSLQWDANQKAKLLNMSMFWYRSASNNQFCAQNDCVNYWTNTEVNTNSVQCIYLWEGADGASRWYGNRGRGVPLRLAHY